MKAEYPPELKGFHGRNMRHALLVVLIPLGAWGWAYYRQEAFAADDRLQSVLHGVFMAGVGLFMLTILIKALITVPKCPACGCRMREIETISMVETTVFNLKSTSRWRIVECPGCGVRYRIPGLS